jgi:hypothetical protein
MVRPEYAQQRMEDRHMPCLNHVSLIGRQGSGKFLTFSKRMVLVACLTHSPLRHSLQSVGGLGARRQDRVQCVNFC